LLVNKYKIPTFFISTKKLLQTNYEKNIFLGYGNENDKFCFILVSALLPESIPSYRIVSSDKNDIFIPITEVKNDCINEIKNALNNQITIEDYLKKFVKIKKPKRETVKSLNLKLQIEQDEENEENK
jgi:hypothetical protein